MSVVFEYLPDIEKRSLNGYTEQQSEPNDKLVISRTSNGKILSKYGDDIWDLSPYKSRQKGTSKFNFKKIKNPSLIQEAKKLTYLIMLYTEGRAGSLLSIGNLYIYFYTIVNLSIYAKAQRLTLKELLSSNKFLSIFILSNPSSSLSRLLNFLHTIDNNLSGINYIKNEEILAILSSKKPETEQTEVIPTSILSESIAHRWEQFNEVNTYINELCVYLKYYQDHREYINKRSFRKDSIHPKWISLYKLFDKYGVHNCTSVPAFIRKIQGTCKHLIHAYSGMRDDEALSLKTACIDEIADTYTNSITRIIGTTTKLEGTKKTTKWVTSKEIVPVIQMLTRLSIVICKNFRIADGEIPLFPSTKILQEVNYNKGIYAYLNNSDQLPLDLHRVAIKESDIKELEEIDYVRDWRNTEAFKIGAPWNFKSHQYRRSLAVYSIQSGIVSIGALRKQFKHLFKEMTFYYGNGASSAKKLFNLPNNHIANDMIDLKPELDALSYIKNVILSDDKLFGIHGSFVEKNIKSDIADKNVYILENRAKTINLFKNGELSYQETALGGCVSSEACNYRLTRSITACLDCSEWIAQKEKLEGVIEKQKDYVEYLDKNSIEYRSELEELQVLEKYKLKINRVVERE